MNLIPLLLGLRVWSAPSATALLTRIFVAVSVISVEIQAVTWLGVGTLRTLVFLNLLLALLLLARARPSHAGSGDRGGRDWFGLNRSLVAGRTVSVREAAPWFAAIALAVLVAALNLLRPLEAADPYHLDKVAQIERTGTWAYDLDADKKLNVLSNVYELVLADVRQLPGAGPWLVRLHGLAGLFLYLVAVAAAREQLQGGGGRRWVWAGMLLVPVVFHQLVLVKNDLFVAVSGFVVLAWVIGRSQAAEPPEFLWAAWLAGFTVAVKLTNLPLLIVIGAAAWLTPKDRWRQLRDAAAGAALGLVSGGLLFIVIENLRWYGDVMPVSEIGNRYAGLFDRIVGVARFGISLIDMGQITRIVWPGRGGWGGTLGLPFIWGLVYLVTRARTQSRARRVLAVAGFHFLAFAVAFPDADIAQRLVLAPALLMVAEAIRAVDDDPRSGRAWEPALVLVLLISAAQIVRSAVLYLTAP